MKYLIENTSVISISNLTLNENCSCKHCSKDMKNILNSTTAIPIENQSPQTVSKFLRSPTDYDFRKFVVLNQLNEFSKIIFRKTVQKCKSDSLNECTERESSYDEQNITNLFLICFIYFYFLLCFYFLQFGNIPLNEC